MVARILVLLGLASCGDALAGEAAGDALCLVQHGVAVGGRSWKARIDEHALHIKRFQDSILRLYSGSSLPAGQGAASLDVLAAKNRELSQSVERLSRGLQDLQSGSGVALSGQMREYKQAVDENERLSQSAAAAVERASEAKRQTTIAAGRLRSAQARLHQLQANTQEMRDQVRAFAGVPAATPRRLEPPGGAAQGGWSWGLAGGEPQAMRQKSVQEGSADFRSEQQAAEAAVKRDEEEAKDDWRLAEEGRRLGREFDSWKRRRREGGPSGAPGDSAGVQQGIMRQKSVEEVETEGRPEGAAAADGERQTDAGHLQEYLDAFASQLNDWDRQLKAEQERLG